MTFQYLIAILLGAVGVFGVSVNDVVLAVIAFIGAVLVAWVEYSTNKKSVIEVQPEPVVDVTPEPVKKPRTRKPAAAKTVTAVKKPAAKKAPAKKVK